MKVRVRRELNLDKDLDDCARVNMELQHRTSFTNYIEYLIKKDCEEQKRVTDGHTKRN